MYKRYTHPQVDPRLSFGDSVPRTNLQNKGHKEYLQIPLIAKHKDMNKARIVNISRIEKNSTGEIINLVVIQLANHKPLVRSLKAFVTDLDNSGRLTVPAQSIVSVKQPSFVRACTKLIGGTVMGEFKEHKVGDKWIITAGHPAIEDANHPLFPKVIGDKVAYEKEGTDIANGTFLTMVPSDKVLEIEEVAYAKASMEREEMDSFGFGSSNSSSNTSEDFDPSTLDANILAEATGEIAPATKK